MRYTLAPIPEILYHGTNARFDHFDLAFKGSNTGWHNTVHGFFFIDNMEHARMFGERIITVSLSFSKMLDLTQHGIFGYTAQAAVLLEAVSGRQLQPKSALKAIYREIGLGEYAEFCSLLNTEESHELFRHYGYDGIISSFGDNVLEFVAFNPEQIRII